MTTLRHLYCLLAVIGICGTAAAQQPVIMTPAQVASGCHDCNAGSLAPCNSLCHDPARAPRFAVSGEFLYLKARDQDVTYSRIMSTGIPGGVPIGDIGQLSPEYQAAFRFGVAYMPTEHFSFGAGWTRYDSNTRDILNAPAGLVVEETLVHPLNINAAEAPLSADGQLGIRFDLYDLEAKATIGCGQTSAIRGLVGVRYAQLDQNLFAHYSVLGDTRVNSEVNFRGVGPRIGLEGELNLLGGFHAYGRGGVSFLIGRFTADMSEFNDNAGLRAASNYRNDRVVPLTELELGLGYNLSNRVTVQAGWQLLGWSNAVTNPNFIQGVQQGDLTTNGGRLRDTMVIDGLTARLMLKF